ncbi:MAG: hypothetical protein JWN14_5168 [Chthonomonadales bacterium]|nr:hypothetical protein [Chthonomonadales bacterium]
MTTLFYALKNNSIPMLDSLIAHGVNLNQPESNGTTPLMIAALESEPRVVRYLVAHGADIHGRGRGGKSEVLWYARHNRSVDREKIRAILSILQNEH